jgi:Tol biopolymer transport system component
MGNAWASRKILALDKYGLFVANLDESNRKFLDDGDPYIVTVPAWSPDGNWVIASVHSPENSQNPNGTPALIEVGTSSIIPLPNMDG